MRLAQAWWGETALSIKMVATRAEWVQARTNIVISKICIALCELEQFQFCVRIYLHKSIVIPLLFQYSDWNWSLFPLKM